MVDRDRAGGSADPSDSGEAIARRLEGLAQDIVRTIRQPILILDDQLGVVTANPAFYEHFEMAESETVGRAVFELGSGEWDIPGLRRLLLEVIPRDASIDDFEVEHDFDGLGPRIILASARQLERARGGSDLILLVLDDVTERVQTERELRRSSADLERFAYHASHDLPPAKADPVQFHQVLQNLLENAIKFSGDGPPVIHVSGERRGKLSVYSVADDGPGIDEGELETVFGMFQRGGRQEQPGSGLGLALCRKIIKHHGGEMWAESDEGGGTTVYFTLPSVDEEPAA